MSEKHQGTAAAMREKMLSRYDDGLHHKHDKNHISYRKHYKSHPIQNLSLTLEEAENTIPTGKQRNINLRKLRKRLDKGHCH